MLSYNIGTDDFVSRAKKGTIEILKALRTYGCYSCSFFFKLFDAQIVPSLLYAAEIWGHRENKQIDIWWAGQVPTVHRSSCKMYSVLVSCAKAACFTVLKDDLPIAVNFTREGPWKLGNLCQVFTVQMWLWLCVVVWGVSVMRNFSWETSKNAWGKTSPRTVFLTFHRVHALRCIIALKVWLDLLGVLGPNQSEMGTHDLPLKVSNEACVRWTGTHPKSKTGECSPVDRGKSCAPILPW